MVSPEMTDLQIALGYWWEDPSLLEEALTHSSYGKPRGIPYSERLEYLGDSVLDLVSAEWLMRQYPLSNEGFMSQCRAGLVRKSTLAELSRRLGLDRVLMVGNEFLRNVESVQADVLEAVVGAMYQDCESPRTVRNCLVRIGFFV